MLNMSQISKKKKKRFKNSSQVDEKYLGPEPHLEKVESATDLDYTRALCWYNYFYTAKDGRKWLEEFTKEFYGLEVYKKLRQVPDNIFISTPCWIAKMIDNGTVFGQEILDYLEQKVFEMIEKAKGRRMFDREEEEKPVQKEISPFQRTMQKVQAMFSELELQIDAFVTNGFKTNWSLYDYLNANGAPSQFISGARTYIQGLYDEMKEFPEDFGSNGSKTAKAAYKATLEFYASLLNDLDRMGTNKKVLRKPRAKKAPSVEKVIAGFKYAPKYDPLKLVSIDPSQILGAKQLWFFNTKWRLLGVYNASDDMGLKIKGTAIENFNPETSKLKKLRKPEETLTEFFQQGKVGLRSFLDKINSQEHPVKARGSEEIVLLKVIK